MKSARFDAQKANLRTSKWIQCHENEFLCEAANEEDASGDPQSDPLADTVTYSADEEVSNESQLEKKSKRNASHDEDFSEFSDISQVQPKYKKTRHQQIYVSFTVMLCDKGLN